MCKRSPGRHRPRGFFFIPDLACHALPLRKILLVRSSIVLVFFGLLLLPFVSCDKSQIPSDLVFNPEQYEYFPLKIGKYIDYQVDSIVFDYSGASTIRDSSSTFVREMVVDTFHDNTGQLLYRVERSERQNETDPWNIAYTFSQARTRTQAIRTEQNLRFLKMVFPMDRRSAWDGNVWIDKTQEIEVAGERIQPFSSWAYEVDSIDLSAHVGAFAFDSTLLITEANDTNVFERRFSRAQYAKRVGLVRREQWILDSQYCNHTPVPSDCDTRPWELKAEKGYILRQTIIAFN